MSDPYRNQPGTNPPRHVPPTNNGTAWTIIAIAAAVVVGVLFWEANGREDRSASTETDATVGRSERSAPIPPADPRYDPARPVPSR